MLRYLTHKLKTQSLSEAESYTPKDDDDHDSGTESDDEGADAEELEKYMSEAGDGCCSSSVSQSDRASSTLDTVTECTETGASPCPPDSALPSDTDAGGPGPLDDRHSSEEELEVINCCYGKQQPPAEKRKWSRLSIESAGSDEEVRDLMCASCPVEFRASPPTNVPRPSRSLSPPPKLFHASSAAIPEHELCHALSPRKRHRRTHRPSLDFEKMQQNRRRRSVRAFGKAYVLCENV